MGLDIRPNKFWIAVAVQVLMFIAFVIPNAAELGNILFVMLFIASEVAIFVPLLFKKEKRYFYFIWQAQIFLVILLSMVFNFGDFFQNPNYKPLARQIFIGSWLAIEALICFGFFVGEKSVKPILAMLASSTTIIVIIIIAFIMREGIYAFTENDPIDFIFGETFQPFYDGDYEGEYHFHIEVEPYDFDLDTNDTKVYFTSNQANLSLWIKNMGAEDDRYTINVDAPPGYLFGNGDIHLDLASGESRYQNISLKSSAPINGNVNITVSSANGGIDKTQSIELISGSLGVDVRPDRMFMTMYGYDAGMSAFEFPITNTGAVNDTYLIEIDTPERFRPSITGDGIDWDYKENKAEVNISANSTLDALFTPRFVTLLEGHYVMNITVTSLTDPQINDEATMYFRYSLNNVLVYPTLALAAPNNGSVSVDMVVNAREGQIVDLIVPEVPEGWSVELITPNGTVASDGETAEISMYRSSMNITLVFTKDAKATEDSFDWIFGVTVYDKKPVFGILPFILGTILIGLISVGIAAPLGIGAAIFLAEYCPKKAHMVVRPVLELLAGIPSVIFGLWGFLTLGPWLNDNIYPLITETFPHVEWLQNTTISGGNLLTASFVLAIMILPIIITLSEDAIRAVPKHLRMASYATGATRLQTVKSVLLKQAMSGIIASVVLAMGRAIGETMAVLMIMGGYTKMPSSALAPVGTMTGIIAAVFGSVTSTALSRHALFGIALVLFVMVFVLNTVIFVIETSTQGKKGPVTRFIERQLKGLKENIKKLFGKGKPVKTGGVELKKIEKLKMVPSSRILLYDKISNYVITATAGICVLFLVFILADVIANGGTSLRPEFFLEREHMKGLEGGFLNAILGSFSLVLIAVLVGLPLSLGAAIFINEYSSPNNAFARVIMFASDTLAATPSIVYGAFGFVFFVVYLQFKLSMIAGGLTLAIMIMPLLLRSSIEALKSVSSDYKEASLALGASKWQTVKKIVLPTAIPGISSGVILGIGRAIGETAAVMFTAGYAASVATSVMHASASMPNMIFLYYELSVKDQILRDKVYAAALSLVIMVVILNTMARIVRWRSERMSRGR